MLKGSDLNASDLLPRRRMRCRCDTLCHTRLLAGIRADGATFTTFPETQVSSGVRMKVKPLSRQTRASSTVPLRGQRSLSTKRCFLLPV